MSNDENSRIADEVRRSGFPLEIEIAELLEKSRWEVSPSFFYKDYDDNEYKELDITAYKGVKSVSAPNDPYRVSLNLSIECKKKEDITWIFFPRRRNKNDLRYGGIGLTYLDSFKVARLSNLGGTNPTLSSILGFWVEPQKFLPEEIARQLWGLDELNLVQARDFSCLALDEIASSFDVVKLNKHGFDRNSERKQVYEALSGLVKAVQDRLVMNATVIQALLQSNIFYSSTNPEFRRYDMHFHFPVLVFDGKLKVWRNGKVSDANMVVFNVQLRTARYFYNRFVNIVSKGYFNEWSMTLEKELNALLPNLLMSKKLADQVKMIEQCRQG